MTAEGASRRLRAAFEVWAGWSAWRHVVAVLALALVALLRHGAAVTEREPLVDERFYLAAFHFAADGESPYAESGFYYPPAFAYAGAALLGPLGDGGMLVLLRGLNVLSLGFVAWLATAWLGTSLASRPWWRGLAVGAALISLTPAWLGLLLGNLSFLAMAPMLGALLWWRRRPVIAGLMLGASLAVKPLAPVAILVLLDRPSGGGRDSGAADQKATRRWTGAGHGRAALSRAAGARRDALEPVEELTQARIVSLHRFLGHAGLGVDPLWVAVAIALAAVLVARFAGRLAAVSYCAWRRRAPRSLRRCCGITRSS